MNNSSENNLIIRCYNENPYDCFCLACMFRIHQDKDGKLDHFLLSNDKPIEEGKIVKVIKLHHIGDVIDIKAFHNIVHTFKILSSNWWFLIKHKNFKKTMYEKLLTISNDPKSIVAHVGKRYLAHFNEMNDLICFLKQRNGKRVRRSERLENKRRKTYRL
jgi:hypothetical protein